MTTSIIGMLTCWRRGAADVELEVVIVDVESRRAGAGGDGGRGTAAVLLVALLRRRAKRQALLWRHLCVRKLRVQLRGQCVHAQLCVARSALVTEHCVLPVVLNAARATAHTKTVDIILMVGCNQSVRNTTTTEYLCGRVHYINAC